MTSEPNVTAGATGSRPGPDAGALWLRPPAYRVCRRAILWWTVRAVLGWLAIIAGPVGWLSLTTPAPPWLPGVVGGLAGLAVIHVAVMPQWRYRTHRWEATADAVYTRTGWLDQDWRVAPASRIQTIDTHRGPLEQLFGLATITITTASAAGPLKIAGLAHDDAVTLVDRLTATTQATPGDAT